MRNLLNSAGFFRWFNRLVGTGRRCQILVRDYIRPLPGHRVLDAGCGLAEILNFMPAGVQYVGVDFHPAYVAAAQRHFEGRGTFYCQNIADITAAQKTRWDRVLAIGVLHHLDDAQALSLLHQAKSALAEGGFFLSVDGCFEENQSWAMKTFLTMDRGRHVRHWKEYKRLAQQVFPKVTVTMRKDLLKIPHTEIIMECRSA